jgi:hypothetical protein
MVKGALIYFTLDLYWFLCIQGPNDLSDSDKQADGRQIRHSAENAQRPIWAEKVLSHVYHRRSGASMPMLE